MIVRGEQRLIFIAFVANLLAICSASWQDPFQEFFPEYNPGFQRVLHGKCEDKYLNYKDNKTNINHVDPELQAFNMVSLTHEVAECILREVPELVKSKMQSAQVLLGLVPTILATLGAGPQETGMLAVVGKQPFLALILGMGSPAVFAVRSFEYVKGVEELQQRRLQSPDFLQKIDILITLAEYVLAFASVANIAELSWRLGAEVIFTTLPNAEFVIVVWMFIGVIIHLFGAGAVALRTRVSRLNKESNGSENKHEKNHLHPHIIPTPLPFKPIARRNSELNVRILDESVWFFILTWLTSIITALHIIWGTMVFSSALFISVNDALKVIGRLIASVVVCRVILTYELSILRGLIHVEHDHQQPLGYADNVEPFRDNSKALTVPL